MSDIDISDINKGLLLYDLSLISLNIPCFSKPPELYFIVSIMLILESVLIVISETNELIFSEVCASA